MTIHAEPSQQDLDASPEEEQVRPPAGRRIRVSRGSVLRATLLIVLLAADLVMVCAWGALQAIEAPTFHLDGAFQTASGLLRLHAGDLPGRDFFPYLGIGPVFLLYPTFAILGGVLSGSVFSAWAMTAALLALLVGVVLALSLRLRSFSAVLAGAGLLLVVLILGEGRFAWAPQQVQALLSPLFQFGIPGNSLRPIRASAPLLLVATTVVALTMLRRRAGLAVIGAAFGVVVACWSNDFALAPSAVVLAFVVHHGVRRRGWRVREIALLAGSFVAAFLVSGFAATGGHYIDYATYNFRDVLGDQFWYFGAWSPRFRVYSPGDLFAFIEQLGAAPGIALLIGLLVVVLLRPSLRWTGVAALGWAAFAGGTVAMIGGHFDDYFLPFRVWAVAASTGIALAVARAVVRRIVGGRASFRRMVPVLGAATAALLAAVLVVGAVKEVRTTVLQRAAVAADTTQSFVPSLGGFLPKTFDAHLAEAPAEGTFVEEYAGLWTALRGPNRRQKVDAVIHALGKERVPFEEALRDSATKAAVTTTPEMSAEWVSWNLSANWWYYRDLLREFLPTVTSPNTIVWRRTTPGAQGVGGRCTVAADGQSIEAAPAVGGLNEIEVQYRGPGQGRRAFSMLENRIDAAADAEGYVALDPGARSQRVPVYATDLSTRRYGLRDVPDRRLTMITSCTVTSVPLPTGSRADAIYGVLWATDRRPIEFTDANYLNGLGRAVPSFIVNRSAPNIADYRVGARVRLADGETRRIVESTPSYNTLVVYLEGAPLPQSLLRSATPLTAVP